MQNIGIDIEEKQRFTAMRFLNRFLEFVMTERELIIAQKQPDMVSYSLSRFAAKEAVIKAVPEKITYHDFEIIKNGAKPTVVFSEKFKHYQASISLSHTPQYVAAVAIIF